MGANERNTRRDWLLLIWIVFRSCKIDAFDLILGSPVDSIRMGSGLFLYNQ